MNNQTATLCRSSDAQLDQLLEEITTRIQAGEMVAMQEYAAAHPEYADRLQQLLPAMQLLVAFGHSQSTSGSSPSSPQSAASSPRILASTTGVLGDFRIIRELGRGGMGVVYEAEQISIGRPVALKVLPFASMLDERRLARFRNEIRAAGQLHHTNIVPIYAVGSDRGVHFYAMQLVAGQTLAEVIEQMRQTSVVSSQSSVTNPGMLCTTDHGQRTTDTSPIAALSTLRSNGSTAFYRTVAGLGIQAAEALEHAHSCGIVHRDIKPSNLLIDQRGTLWLTDFGLAAIDSSGDLTMSGDLLGTIRYMSPEQTLGSRVVLDHRTDIYSLGATLYELLTLQPAFDAPDRGELLRQIAVVEPRAPRRIDPAIPADLETIVLKAMSKDATSRYTSAQRMADDLQRFLANKPIEARRPSFVERGRKWVGRHSQLAAIAAGSLVVISIVSAAATIFTLQAYTAEAEQRAAADANLKVASQIIDRMLSRVSDDRYYQGDLQQAETLAADATEFYDELLTHSNEPDLRFRAAIAHGDAAHIWQLIGRHEKAGIANRRAGELLQRLTTAFPGEPKYLMELARNFNHRGLVDWSLDRPLAAEPSFRQAWEIWIELAERFPQEPAYQGGVADMLANLGSVCYFSDRFDEAEEYYRRAEAIAAHLPADLKNSAEGLASQAGSLTNQAELARLRGQYDRALELLEQSIPLHKQSLEKWPTNPVALDCYFHTHWNIGECQLGAGRADAVAAAVEKLVETFPERLSAYHEGASLLLRCAALASARGLAMDQEGETRREGEGEKGTRLESASPTLPLSPSPTLQLSAATYRQRAHELIVKAHDAPQKTPDAAGHFAWFLLMCADKSFRDAPRALELAKTVVIDVPERGEAWFTLALAHYRNGERQAADDAVQKSIEHARDEGAKAESLFLLSMIRHNQGRTPEAQEWHEKAQALIAKNRDNHSPFTLAAEADELLNATYSKPNNLVTDHNEAN